MQPGIRQDAQHSKESGETYDPRGTGVAWSHGFLNQKPWHPSSFRNQQRRWEAEQKHAEKQKRIEEGKREFETEQEQFKSLSYLSTDEQKKYKDRQSLAFMYMRPPGLEAALKREEDALKRKDTEQKDTQGESSKKQVSATESLQTSTSAPKEHIISSGGPPLFSAKGPVKTMLQGCAVRESDHRTLLLPGSAPCGGFDLTADNQQLVIGPEDLMTDVRDGDGADPKLLRRLKKAEKKEKRKREVAHARAVLEAAGYDVEELTQGLQQSRRRKRKSKDKRDDKRKSRARDAQGWSSDDTNSVQDREDRKRREKHSKGVESSHSKRRMKEKTGHERESRRKRGVGDSLG